MCGKEKRRMLFPGSCLARWVVSVFLSAKRVGNYIRPRTTSVIKVICMYIVFVEVCVVWHPPGDAVVE